MRFAQIYLKAFGHFTERRITLDPTVDFHVVYGPNEAGKTTISRALKAVLFGVPNTTVDNHLHANKELRVGMCLEANGSQISVMRRKGTKNTLVKYDPLSGEESLDVVEDDVLNTTWMGSLSEVLYTSMFSLSHDELVAGGKALSEGKGEAGQSLFAASAGVASISSLQKTLANEADNLFRPSAKSTAINQTLAEYNATLKEVADQQTKPVQWQSLQKEVNVAKADYQKIFSEQKDIQNKIDRLRLLTITLPDIASRSFALERLENLGKVITIAPEASGKRISAQAQLEQATENKAAASDTVGELGRQISDIQFSQTVLDEGGAIESLHYKLEPYRLAQAQTLSSTLRINTANEEIKKLLTAIGLSPQQIALRELIPSATLRARVQSLASKGAALQADHKNKIDNEKKIREELEELLVELEGLGSFVLSPALAQIISNFEERGNPESLAEDLSKQIVDQELDLTAEAKVFGGTSIDALVSLVPPSIVLIQQFQNNRNELSNEAVSIADKIQSTKYDIAKVSGEIEGLNQQGEVPTSEQLIEKRNIRNTLWQRIRRHVYHDPSTPIETEPLPQAIEYETAVSSADTTADSRFSDAARVSQYAELIKRIAQMNNAIELDQIRKTENAQKKKDLDQKWEQFIDQHRLPKLGIDELGAWLYKREIFLPKYHSIEKLKKKMEDLVIQSKTMRSAFSAGLTETSLPSCGDTESLAQAITRARVFIENASQTNARRKILTERQSKSLFKITNIETEIAAANLALNTWTFDWNAAMKTILLPENATTEEAVARLGEFETLEKSLNDFDNASTQLGQAEKTIAELDGEVDRLCVKTQYDRENRVTDAIVETLYNNLTVARSKSQVRATLQSRIGDAKIAEGLADKAIQAANRILDELKASAHCNTLEDLIQAEIRSADSQILQTEVADIEKRMVSNCALPLVKILEEADKHELEIVKSDLKQAESEIETIAPQVESKLRTQVDAENALNKVEGGTNATDSEQRALQATAKLSNQIADYAACRFSSIILAKVIETYQQRFQGPLLERASILFAEITNGRFTGIATDFDEDKTVLVGVRANKKRETVENLSSGTRDQLFLALRLAAIEIHVDKNPMPVVVDDIVINFDDEATSATFKALADLSKKTQVLFFTHHQHLLDVAEKSIGQKSFVPHRLSDPLHPAAISAPKVDCN